MVGGILTNNLEERIKRRYKMMRSWMKSMNKCQRHEKSGKKYVSQSESILQPEA
jgi:hypothetical protein